ncbi:MAG: metal ABC transporter substrate-binding protein [Myxococcales bacterium]
MRTVLTALLSLLLLPTSAQALNVVATTPDLAAIAKEIGGAHARVTALALPTQDPHFVDARPSLVLEVNKADLLLVVGLELEVGWLPTLITGSRNGRIQQGSRGYLDCSQYVKLLDVPKQKIDRSMGDVHAGGNPHYTYDPRAVVNVARGIAARMGEFDPEHRADYEKNLADFLTRLEAAREGWEKRLAPWRGQPIVAYHMSWSYVADWLGLKQIAFLEPKPGIPPNPTHVAMVLTLARKNAVKVLVQEEFYPDTASALVAGKIPAALVKVPGGTDFRGGQSYLQFIETMVARLEKGFASMSETK